jgi:hypothetical protein
MADEKISNLTAGGASQAADEYVIARSGNNFKVTGANVAAAATQVGAAGTSVAFTSAMTLNASGNLGLGVTPSAWAASSRTIDIGQFTCVGQNTSGAAILAFNAFQNSAGTWTYKTNNPAARHETGVNGTAAHAWYTAPSGTAGNAISFTQALTLDPNGRIGIATATPANPLSVIGNVGVGAADFTASAYLHANAPSGANRNIGQFSVAGASNGMQINWDHASTTLRVILNNIPTSSAGLAAGTLWNDSGTIKIA